MPLSWSHKLFLRINQQIGTHPWRDRGMRWCAVWLVYALWLIALLWAFVMFAHDQGIWFRFSLFLGLSFFVSLLFGYGIALLWPHPRPVREFPMIKELVHPLVLWKSFPSDHTMASVVVVVALVVFAAPLWLISISTVGALCVMAGRVYAGAHYPRDIIGGVVISFTVSLILARFLV
jgi:undecaprenyl-diphosphatase